MYYFTRLQFKNMSTINEDTLKKMNYNKDLLIGKSSWILKQ